MSVVAMKTIHRVEIPIEAVDLLSVLAQQDSPVKIYWSDEAASFSCAGWGACLSTTADEGGALWDEFAGAKADPNVHFYGGFAFDPARRDAAWSDLGAGRFVLPLFEVVKRGEKFFFCGNLIDGKTVKEAREVEAILRQIYAGKAFESSIPALKARKDEPEFPEWKKNVDSVLADISRGALKKVVLARQSEFTFADNVDAISILKELEKLAPRSSRFLFQFSKDTAFFGASPEKLYRRQGNQITSAAVAGTRPRGKSGAEDEALKKELIVSPKENNEHALVVRYIEERLKKVCDELNFSAKPEVLTLNHAFHLKTQFQGTIKSSVSDKDIFQALHPTPAVCGVAQDRALECIRQHETFSRGWFAGAVGCVGAEATDFVVAIRSALVTKNIMRVFAGAGIVEGSVAQNEWEEIDHKIENLLKVIKAK